MKAPILTWRELREVTKERDRYREALVRIRTNVHRADCAIKKQRDDYCDCHVSIAEEALGKVKE
jgi:hypothetical protein